MTINSINLEEVAKFSQLAQVWWDKNGPLKTLHDINPVRVQFIEKYSKIPQARILDVGCGGGILCEEMAKLGAKVTGLDVDPAIIDVAQEHAKNNQLDIDYVCQAIETYEAESFDYITCMEMLEHVSSPALIIQQCARLLKPGGCLFLSTINRTLHAYLTVIVAAEYILKLLPQQTHNYAQFIQPSELCEMSRRASLELVDIKGMGYNPLTRNAFLCDSLSANYLVCLCLN